MIDLIPVIFSVLFFAVLSIAYLVIDIRKSKKMAQIALELEPTSRLSRIETIYDGPKFTELVVRDGKFVRKEEHA